MLKKFNWGIQDLHTQKATIDEIYNHNMYEKIFQVEEGDIVVDLGGSNGIFSFSVLDKKPSFIYVVEPISDQVKLIDENLGDYPHSTLHGAISDLKKINSMDWGVFQDNNITTYSFSEFLEKYNIDKIDFMKVDIEGGEYYIFKEEHINFLKGIPKIVGEFHLGKNSELHNCKFRYFRDNILQHFPNFHVYSLDGIDIKWDLWNEHFLDYYHHVIFHFDNRI